MTHTSQAYPMLTATEAAAQGSTPATFFSIAKFNDRMAERDKDPACRDTARRARAVARELAGILGVDVGGRRQRGANDNRALANRGHDNGRKRRAA